jgi:hypothetical protein
VAVEAVEPIEVVCVEESTKGADLMFPDAAARGDEGAGEEVFEVVLVNIEEMVVNIDRAAEGLATVAAAVGDEADDSGSVEEEEEEEDALLTIFAAAAPPPPPLPPPLPAVADVVAPLPWTPPAAAAAPTAIVLEPEADEKCLRWILRASRSSRRRALCTSTYSWSRRCSSAADD